MKTRNHRAELREGCSDKIDTIVTEIARQAEDQARKGEGFDLAVNDPTELLETLPDQSDVEFTLVR